MAIVKPVVGATGPGWATTLNTALDALDSATAAESARAIAAEATKVATSSIGIIGGIAGPLDASFDIPIGQVPALGVNNGIATLNSRGHLFDAQLADSIMMVITIVNGAYGFRYNTTTSTARTVIWRGATNPSFADGFAIAGIDWWIDDDGTLWVSTADGVWHGSPGGSTTPVVKANLVTQATMIVTGITGGGTAAGILYGSSPGGTTQARMTATVTALAPRIIRTFEPAPVPASWSANGQGHYVPAGIPQCTTTKPTVTIMSNTGDAGYVAARDALRTYYAGMEDIKNQRAGIWHEPEGNAGFTPAQWAQANINFKNDVITFVNLSRTNPIKHIGILQGFTLTAGSGRDISTWFTPGLLAVIDELGFDIYNPAQISLAGSYSTTVGVPWSVPEYGYSVSTVGTDAQQKSYLAANTPTFKTMSNPPKFVMHFNGAVTFMVSPTNAASGIGATSVTVLNVPGLASTIASWPASPITVGYQATGPESVTMTGAATQTTAGVFLPYNLPVPALANAHASGDPVALNPTAAAYWRSICLA